MFTVGAPDGQLFEVDAPDPQSAAGAVEEMLSGGGGQNTMRGGNAQDAPQRPGSMRFDHLIPGGGQLRAPQGAGPRPPAQKPGSMRFDHIGVSRDAQMDQAFNPHNPRNRAAERPDLAQAMDARLHADDDARGAWATAGDALSMGVGDEVLGAMVGGLMWAKGGSFTEGYDAVTGAARRDVANYAERHPGKALAINVAGAIPTAFAPGGAAVKGLGLLRKAGVPVNLATKMGLGAATGAAAGAAQGYARGEGGVGERLDGAEDGAMWGSAFGAGAPAIGAGIGKVAGGIMGRRGAPTAEALKNEAQQMFRLAEQSGVQFAPRAVQRLGMIRGAVMGSGRNVARLQPSSHPRSLEALAFLDDVARQPSLSFPEVMTVRQTLRDFVSAARRGSKDENEAGEMLDMFDRWSAGLAAKDMVPGTMTGREAFQTFSEANRLWSTMRKGEELARVVERAMNKPPSKRAAAIRQGFETLANKQWLMRSFSEKEQDQIKKVAAGGPVRWILDAVQGAMPNTKTAAGMMKLAGHSTAGGAIAGIPGAIAFPALTTGIGSAARAGVNSSIKRGANLAGAMARSGQAKPFDPVAARVAGSYAERLSGAAGQTAVPLLLPKSP